MLLLLMCQSIFGRKILWLPWRGTGPVRLVRNASPELIWASLRFVAGLFRDRLNRAAVQGCPLGPAGSVADVHLLTVVRKFVELKIPKPGKSRRCSS